LTFASEKTNYQKYQARRKQEPVKKRRLSRRARRRRAVFSLLLLAALALLLYAIFANRYTLTKMFYPVPYYDEIAAVCEAWGEEVPLVLAMIQTESNFRPEVTSPKGARGLMQVMPDTGMWMADRMGLADFSADLLFEREWNLQIGVAYLAYLRQLFDGDEVLAIAAYNAGPTRVRGWLQEGVWDGSEASLADIPFKETRDYVRKVLDRLARYQRLYS
jgi:soluble lytic murein transglycosylase